MYLLRSFILLILILALGCGGGPATTTQAPKSVSDDFRRVCKVLGATGGQISRQQFLAQSKDKEAAAQVFDACDTNRDLFISQEEAAQNVSYFEDLKSQVILFHTPRGR